MDIQKATYLMHSCWGISIDQSDKSEKETYYYLHDTINHRHKADINADGHIAPEEIVEAAKTDPDIERVFDEVTRSHIRTLDLSRSSFEQNRGNLSVEDKLSLIKDFGRLNDKASVDMLFYILTNDNNWQARQISAEMLGIKFDDSADYAAQRLIDAIPMAENGTLAGEGFVSAAIFIALGELRYSKSVPQLLEALKYPPTGLKNSPYPLGAVIGLCKIGEPKSLKEFRSVLSKYRNSIPFDSIRGEDPYPYIKLNIGATPCDPKYLKAAKSILQSE